MHGFKTVSVRATDDEIRQWRINAVENDQKFGDWLRDAITFYITSVNSSKHGLTNPKVAKKSQAYKD